LCPSHAASIPIKDPWGNDYLIYCRTKVNGRYGISGSVAEDYLIVSFGRDGKVDGWTYDPNHLRAKEWVQQDPNYDIINLKRIFIRGQIKDPIK